MLWGTSIQSLSSSTIFAVLALLAGVLTLWQWWAARCFPLHQRVAPSSFAPPVTVLKPLKGSDEATEECLRSWFALRYPAAVQLLFAVDSADDPACSVVRKLQNAFPASDAQLLVCHSSQGLNSKVSKLIQLLPLARHDVLVISDADVLAPPDLLSQALAPLGSAGVALVNCFYRLATPRTLAMQYEAVAINADFWSQVLQARTLKPMDFALGAVMMLRRSHLTEIGGFEALLNCLADDYQLGHRLAERGHRVELSPVVVDCCSAAMGWGAVWKHQLRWARTIRVCQPLPYFFSVLSNGTFWPALWALVHPRPFVLAVASGCILLRVLAGIDMQRKLTGSLAHLPYAWLIPVKDLLQIALWALAFTGSRVEWRGERMDLRQDGTLERA